MFHFYQMLFFTPIRMGFPAKFIGKENIPEGACIIASNHVSNLDAILLALHTWEKKFYFSLQLAGYSPSLMEVRM